MNTILIIAVIALFIGLAFSVSGNTTKKAMIKEKDEVIQSLRKKLNNTMVKNSWMMNKLDKIERELPSILYAVDDKGNEVDYYRIKVMDEKDDFNGYNVGDKVPHIRRKIKYVWKNVPVTLKLKRS